MTDPAIWCSYCRKATHTDSECLRAHAEQNTQHFSRTGQAVLDGFNKSREHALSAHCWCFPTLAYVDPVTQDSVYVHNNPQ